MIRTEKLDFWIKNRTNFLLIGGPGVGKTTMCLELFARHNLQLGAGVAYYSSIEQDIVGNVKDAKIIYFDDLGTDHARTDHARAVASEIISLRVVHGVPIAEDVVVIGNYTTNIVNPTMSIDDLPVELEKFAVKIEVPNKPNRAILATVAGEKAADAAIAWSQDLDPEHKISSRRLEQALIMWKCKGDMRDVLPIYGNVAKLMAAINVAPIADKLDELIAGDNVEEAKKFLADNNANITFSAWKKILGNKKYFAYFLPLVPETALVKILRDFGASGEDKKFIQYVTAEANNVPAFKAALKIILNANEQGDKNLVKYIRRALTENMKNS